MERTIDFRLLTESRAKEYDAVWNTFKQEFPGLSNNDLIKMVSLATYICGACRNANRKCQCWNDE